MAKVAPLFAFRDKEGVVESVRYERLTVVLINAVKEQQKHIESQQKQIDGLLNQNARQRKQIERLTKMMGSIKSQLRKGRK